MLTRYEVAVRLDIPLEMASRHGVPTRMSEKQFEELDTNPPPWLAQSRANRPKKWWPAFTYISCTEHSPLDLPEPAGALARTEIDGIGTRFVGIVDA
jgi:hypothetical protein